jgi:hypothetical protein
MGEHVSQTHLATQQDYHLSGGQGQVFLHEQPTNMTRGQDHKIINHVEDKDFRMGDEPMLRWMGSKSTTQIDSLP